MESKPITSGRVAILGMATADLVFRAEAPLADRRTIAVAPMIAGWRPRAGGAPLYCGRALLAAGHKVALVFALGDDAIGGDIVGSCRAVGFDTGALHIQPGARTPGCLLVYGPDGRDTCLFDPGSVVQDGLTAAQEAALAQADLIVIAAAPSALVERALAQIGEGRKLAWIFKDDPLCFPAPLCARLMARADCVFFNEAESAQIDRWRGLAGPATLLFKTLGARGVEVRQGNEARHLPVDRLDVTDPTGAGDTFAGHALAGLLAAVPPLEAARTAIVRTAAFLAGDRR